MLTRRELLAAGAAALPALALGQTTAGAAPADEPVRNRLGVVDISYANRKTVDRDRGVPDSERLDDPLTFLSYCHDLGAGGVQIPIGRRDAAYADRLREAVERFGMYLEDSIRLPKDLDDVQRFETEVRTAKAAGATVLRTVMLGGRRYETFDSAEAFRRFADQAWRSLTLAEPVVARHQMRLAVENHKDWRAAQLVGLLKKLDSKHVGVCVDTGNNIALLEDPTEVVETLAPWAFSIHLKDMGVEEYDQGFLLSEVPLGDGFLDLPRLVRTLRAARPEVRFSLEMITRDPLQIPCLAPRYWATFDDLPGRDLARTLALVRAHASKRPLPRVAQLGRDEKLKLEDDNVRRCLAYARANLGL